MVLRLRGQLIRCIGVRQQNILDMKPSDPKYFAFEAVRASWPWYCVRSSGSRRLSRHSGINLLLVMFVIVFSCILPHARRRTGLSFPRSPHKPFSRSLPFFVVEKGNQPLNREPPQEKNSRQLFVLLPRPQPRDLKHFRLCAVRNPGWSTIPAVTRPRTPTHTKVE